MAQSNTLPPGSGAVLPDVGQTYAWVNTGNILSDNNSYANCAVAGNVAIADHTVNLVDSSQTIVGDNKALGSNWAGTEETVTYGSQTDMWGTTLTVSDVNTTNFGWAIRAKNVTSSAYSDPLYAYNYGYSISPKAKIIGFEPKAHRRRTYDSRSGITTGSVDYMPMTVHYQFNYPQIRIISFLLPLFTKLLTGISATGVLSMFGVIKLEYKNGLVIQASQTRKAGRIRLITT